MAFQTIRWVVAVAFAMANAPAIAQSLAWERTLAGVPGAFAAGAGSVAIVGTSISGPGTDFIVTRLDGANGAVVWQKAFSHPSGQADDAVSAAIDAQGNVIVAGHSLGAAGNTDIIVAKYRVSDGLLLWQKTFDGGKDDFARKVRIDGAGNAIVAGESVNASGDSDVRVLKFAAADGAILWQKTFDSGRADYISDLALDSAGNAYAAGMSANAAGNDDFAVLKLAAADGALVWRSVFDGGATDQPNAIAVDAGGNAIVTGYSKGSTVDFRTVKFAAANGAVSWSKAFDGGSEDLAQAVALDLSGNAIVAGHARNAAGNFDIKTIKYAAADGAVLWERTLDGGADDFAYQVAVDSAGNATVAGSRMGGAGSDWSVVQYAADGSQTWQYNYAGSAGGDDGAFAVALAPGGVFVAGSAQETSVAPAIRIVKIGAPAVAASADTSADWNADRKPDILMRNALNGNLFVWYMNGRAVASDAFIAGIDPSWRLEGVADFNGDGKPDLVWRNSASGATWVWYMNGTALVSDAPLFTLDPVWKVEAVADFNRDGKPDFLLRNTSSGLAFVWYFNDHTPVADQYLFTIDPSWKVEAVGDVNGDGQPDLLFRNTSSGLAFVWNTTYSGGALSLGASSPPMFSIDPAWEVAQFTDWNADGKPDLLFRNKDSGVVFVWYMAGTTLGASDYLFQVDPSWEIVPRR